MNIFGLLEFLWQCQLTPFSLPKTWPYGLKLIYRLYPIPWQCLAQKGRSEVEGREGRGIWMIVPIENSDMTSGVQIPCGESSAYRWPLKTNSWKRLPRMLPQYNHWEEDVKELRRNKGKESCLLLKEMVSRRKGYPQCYRKQRGQEGSRLGKRLSFGLRDNL